MMAERERRYAGAVLQISLGHAAAGGMVGTSSLGSLAAHPGSGPSRVRRTGRPAESGHARRRLDAVVYELLRYPEDKPPFDAAHAAFEAVMGREWDEYGL